MVCLVYIFLINSVQTDFQYNNSSIISLAYFFNKNTLMNNIDRIDF